MGTDTTPDLAALRSDMQDVLYGAIYHNRYDTSAEAMDALLPIVERYAAAKTANELEAGETRTEWGVRFRDQSDREMSRYGEAEQAAREFAAYPPVKGYRVEKRTVHTSPWVPVEDEAAELAGRDGDTTHA